jgi:hypothetical protein
LLTNIFAADLADQSASGQGRTLTLKSSVSASVESEGHDLIAIS